MNVHLIDGTYELFRQYFDQPESQDADGNEIGAARGVLQSTVALLEEGATHVGVATDHVIESFRNDLFYGYKTGDGIEPDLWSQFPLLEESLTAMGVHVWPMVELEADDALASAAAVANDLPQVEKVIILTPDKDLHQCVQGKVIQYDRRNQKYFDVAAVVEKLGIEPESVPDYLALVGDTADGIPGITGWGAKSSATVLARYKHLEEIPRDVATWDVTVRSAVKLAANLFDNWEDVLLFRTLATLRIDRDLLPDVDELRWTGPKPEFSQYVERFRLGNFGDRVQALAASRAD